jgi:hypothetical protein
MSRADLEDALARVLEGKEIRLKNNKSPLQPRCIEQFTIPRVKTHWPVIFAIALTDSQWAQRPDFNNHPWPALHLALKWLRLTLGMNIESEETSPSSPLSVMSQLCLLSDCCQYVCSLRSLPPS